MRAVSKIIALTLYYSQTDVYPSQDDKHLTPDEWCYVCDMIDYIKEYYEKHRMSGVSFDKVSKDARIYAVDKILTKYNRKSMPFTDGARVYSTT